MSTRQEFPFVMKNSETFGRYLVAEKTLPAGRMIFKEDALFVYSHFKDTLLDEEKITCISCYRVIDKTKVIRCRHCHWGFCSLTCSKEDGHQKLECKVLSRNGVLPSPVPVKFLFLIRFLQLEKKDKKKWEKAMNLTATFGTENPTYEEYAQELSLEAKLFLQTSCKLNVSLDYIKKIVKLMRINSFTFKEEIEGEQSGKKYYALYATCCLIAHSCAPNTEWHLVRSRNELCSSIGLYTRKEIIAGEMITIPYTEDYFHEGTRQRRDSLFKRFNFWCGCDRCLDPTELGTSYSSGKCPTCVNGSMIPPQCVSLDKRFRCDQCDFSSSFQKIKSIEDTFQRKLLALKNKDEEYQRKSLDDMIANASSLYQLHSNHNLVIEAIRRWFEVQSFSVLMESTPESESIYQKIIQRVELSLHIISTFGPSPLRIKLQCIISGVMLRFNFKSNDYLTMGKDVEDLNNKIAILKKIVKHLRIPIPAAADPDNMLFDCETRSIIQEMKIRYFVWYDRLSKCLLLNLKGTNRQP